MQANTRGEIEITVHASKRGTVADKIAEAVQFGHGLLRLTIVRPDGSVMRLKCLDMNFDGNPTYQPTRDQ